MASPVPCQCCYGLEMASTSTPLCFAQKKWWVSSREAFIVATECSDLLLTWMNDVGEFWKLDCSWYTLTTLDRILCTAKLASNKTKTVYHNSGILNDLIDCYTTFFIAGWLCREVCWVQQIWDCVRSKWHSEINFEAWVVIQPACVRSTVIRCHMAGSQSKLFLCSATRNSVVTGHNDESCKHKDNEMLTIWWMPRMQTQSEVWEQSVLARWDYENSSYFVNAPLW